MWQSIGRLLLCSGATNSTESVNNSESDVWLFLECCLVPRGNVLVLRVMVEICFRETLPLFLSFGFLFVVNRDRDEGRLKEIAEFHFISRKDY